MRASVSVVVVVCLYGSVAAETHTYVFDPCQSTVLERNWAWGYSEEWYTIEGEFQFTFDVNDLNPGTAWFDWVDANLSEEISYWDDGYQTTESLDILFHMTDLNSTVGNPNGIELVYEKNNPIFPQADVNVRVEYVGDSLHLTGTFWDEAYDGDRYDLNAVAVLKKYGGGLGDGNYPYLIYDANQMNAIGANPNDWDKHFKLMADIDLGRYTGTSFNIIGNLSVPFTGVFDGGNHTIFNFAYDSNDIDEVGLFGSLSSLSGCVRDVKVSDPCVSVMNGFYVAALVGYMEGGSINRCRISNGFISGRYEVGALVGWVYDGSVTESCVQKCRITGDDEVGGLTGGISWGNVSRAYPKTLVFSVPSAISGIF